jgi:hypothetical protein
MSVRRETARNYAQERLKPRVVEDSRHEGLLHFIVYLL